MNRLLLSVILSISFSFYIMNVTYSKDSYSISKDTIRDSSIIIQFDKYSLTEEDYNSSNLQWPAGTKIYRSDSAAIIQFENNWAQALIKKDKEAFNKYLSPGFFYTENENLYSREEVLQSLLSVTDVVEDAFNEGMLVHLYDNTAIVTGWLYINGKIRNKL